MRYRVGDPVDPRYQYYARQAETGSGVALRLVKRAVARNSISIPSDETWVAESDFDDATLTIPHFCPGDYVVRMAGDNGARMPMFRVDINSGKVGELRSLANMEAATPPPGDAPGSVTDRIPLCMNGKPP